MGFFVIKKKKDSAPKRLGFLLKHANACTAVCKKQEGVVVNSDCCQLVRKSKWQMVQCSSLYKLSWATFLNNNKKKKLPTKCSVLGNSSCKKFLQAGSPLTLEVQGVGAFLFQFLVICSSMGGKQKWILPFINHSTTCSIQGCSWRLSQLSQAKVAECTLIRVASLSQD